MFKFNVFGRLLLEFQGTPDLSKSSWNPHESPLKFLGAVVPRLQDSDSESEGGKQAAEGRQGATGAQRPRGVLGGGIVRRQRGDAAGGEHPAGHPR